MDRCRTCARLLFTPGVMVTSVPYQLRSSQIAKEREDWELARARPGDVRRGQILGDPTDKGRRSNQ